MCISILILPLYPSPHPYSPVTVSLFFTSITLFLFCAYMCAKSLQSCLTAALQASLSMGLSRQEHWSGLPSPPSVL